MTTTIPLRWIHERSRTNQRTIDLAHAYFGRKECERMGLGLLGDCLTQHSQAPERTRWYRYAKNIPRYHEHPTGRIIRKEISEEGNE